MFQTLRLNRYLLQELVWRDVRSRYVGSVLGFFWSVLNPILQLSLYTLVFGSHLKIRFQENGTTGSFAIALFCALLPWIAFQESVARSADVFISHSNLLKKVRFPMEVLPLSMVASAVIHQCIGMAVFVTVLGGLQQLSLSTLPLLGVLMGIQIVMMIGASNLVATLNVFFRDISQVIGIGFMFLFWVTPIVYSRNISGSFLGEILAWNPLTHMVEGYRAAFLGNSPVNWLGLAYWLFWALLVLGVGQWLLRRTRAELLDRL